MQRVTVVGSTACGQRRHQPPALSVGAEVDLDLAPLFVDPFDAALTFAIERTAERHRPCVRSINGRLTGTPSSADRDASPLALTVTASKRSVRSDGQSCSGNRPASARVHVVDDADQCRRGLRIRPHRGNRTAGAYPAGDLERQREVVPRLAEVNVAPDGSMRLLALPDSNGDATLTVTARNRLTDLAVTRSLPVRVAP